MSHEQNSIKHFTKIHVIWSVTYSYQVGVIDLTNSNLKIECNYVYVHLLQQPLFYRIIVSIMQILTSETVIGMV